MIFRKASAEDLPVIVNLLAADQLGASREDATLPLAPEYLAAFAAMPHIVSMIGSDLSRATPVTS